jgi:putative tricarboxylic transport membrane protein
LENFIASSIQLFGNPVAILLFTSALVSGLVFGSVPGLSSMTLAAIFLPFSVFLSSEHAILFYGVIYVAGVYGGATTAILFNIPGSVENTATTFDGYPMVLKGQAGKAVGLAITSSAIGGTLSCVVMMIGTAPIARWAISAISPIEKFAIVFFALAVVSGIGGGSFWKRWISLFVGLWIGTIGTDPVGGLGRFSFGSYYLMSGINFTTLILGFFAITEVFVQGERLVKGTYKAPKASVDFPTLKEFWRLKIPIIRSSVIGFVCGVLPGVGAALASFLSYSEAVRWSKHPERFGKGEPEGVVAAETANNAATGGAMVPLLALGLPGGGFTAIMIGVFTLHDLTPGPLVMIQHKTLVWVLFSGMFWASLAILFLGLLETRLIVNLLRIPFAILGPMIVFFSTIGAYSLRYNILDVWTIFVAGIIGYILRRYDYAIAAMVMGVILGQIGEEAFYQSMVLMDYDVLGFFGYPTAAVFIVLGLATVGSHFVRYFLQLKASSSNNGKEI